MLSRVYACLSQEAEAQRYAGECQLVSQELGAFYRAYACEAAARAERVLGEEASCARFLEEAEGLMEEVEGAEERELLAVDLNELRQDAADGC